MSKTKLNNNNPTHQLIIGACGRLISEGYTAREIIQLLENTKNELFPALRQTEVDEDEE